MTEAEVLLAITQGLIAILVATGGFLLRRALDDSREAGHQITALRERVVRLEAQTDGLHRLELKIDKLVEDLSGMAERLASIVGPQVR